MKRQFLTISLILALMSLVGCAAINTEMQYGDLKIYSYSGDSIFLETTPKTAFLRVNAPKELMHLDKAVANKLTNKGIQIANTPEEADAIIFINLVDANVTEKTARQVDHYGSGGSVVGATALGGGLGYLTTTSATGAVAGAGIGLVGGAIADLTVNNWVKLGRLTIRADIQVREKLSGGLKSQVASKVQSGSSTVVTQSKNIEDDYLRHQTAVSVTAQRTNLKWEDCATEVNNRLADLVSNVF